jgi:hypothetical protein
MGLGDFPAGEGLGGLDPIPLVLGPNGLTAPVALRYDGATKDFLLDANGHYLGIHPVDQQVALALICGLGTMPAAPKVGAAFRQIKRITPSTPKQAEDMARTALSSLVSGGLIKIVAIEVETTALQGAVLIAVTYVNMLTQKRPTFSLPSASFTGL